VYAEKFLDGGICGGEATGFTKKGPSIRKRRVLTPFNTAEKKTKVQGVGGDLFTKIRTRYQQEGGENHIWQEDGSGH